MAGKGPRNTKNHCYITKRNTVGRIPSTQISPRTGRVYKPTPEGKKKPGPPCRRDKFTDAIEACINSPLLDEWVTADEIAYHANKSMPKRWSQITPFVVGQIMRKYVASGHIEKDRFKTLDPFSYRRLEYI